MLAKMDRCLDVNQKLFSDFFQLILGTGRLVFAATNRSLRAGGDKKINCEWYIDESGNQSMKAKDGSYLIFSLHRPRYINLADSTIGNVVSENPSLLNHLLKADAVKPEEIDIVRGAIASVDKTGSASLPKKVKISKLSSIMPKAILTFSGGITTYCSC